MAGIATAAFFPLPLMSLVILLAATLVLFLFLLTRPPGAAALPACMLIFLLVGHISMLNVLEPPPDPRDISRYEGLGNITLEGLVIESPNVTFDRTEMNVETTSVLIGHQTNTARGKVLLVMRDSVDSFKYGDFLRIHTKLRTPKGYKNPGAFDYARFLRLKGIRLQGFVDHPSSIVLIRERQGDTFRQGIEALRGRIKQIIRQASPAPESGILEALIVGERGGIPIDIQEKFNRTGTAHILSISGLHISIIALVSVCLIRFILKYSEYLLLRFSLIKVAAFLSLVPIFFYAFVAGMSIPTVRSVIMVVSFLIAVLLGRPRELLNALGLAAFLILVFSPASLFDISFQLSFMAVFAILYLAPKLTACIPRPEREETEGPVWRAWPRKWLVSLIIFLAASLAATLGTAPLVACYFNRVSLVTLPANLVIVPLLGFVVLILGLAAMALSFISEATASCLFHGASLVVRPSLGILDWMDRIPGSSVAVTTPGLHEIVAFYLFVGVFACGLSIWRETGFKRPLTDLLRLHRGPVVLALFLIFFFIADMIFLAVKEQNEGRLRTTFLDVGHGNATLVEFPGGRRMLVDGGGSFDGRFDFGRHVVAPFLWKMRIKKIDTIVLTHPHPDHLNGLLFILEHFGVEELWTNGEKSDDPSFESLMNTVGENKITTKILSARSEPFPENGVSIRVFNPPRPISGGRPFLSDHESNNSSLVLKFTYHEVSILLAGDIATPAESVLIHSGADLRSNVLLVPHHGLRQSCSVPFLRRVNPAYAVISSRETPFLKAPHPEVIERLEGSGAKIYRTDHHGAVTAETDGRTVIVRSYKSN
jgi:competence protein ComEC